MINLTLINFAGLLGSFTAFSLIIRFGFFKFSILILLSFEKLSYLEMGIIATNSKVSVDLIFK